jgi:hypothetical protein
MITRKPTLWQQLSAALCILTGRWKLFLGANQLNAHWLSESAGINHICIRLDIRINKKAYTAVRTFQCDATEPAERKVVVDRVMTEMVTEVFRKVLVGG